MTAAPLYKNKSLWALALTGLTLFIISLFFGPEVQAQVANSPVDGVLGALGDGESVGLNARIIQLFLIVDRKSVV